MDTIESLLIVSSTDYVVPPTIQMRPKSTPCRPGLATLRPRNPANVLHQLSQDRGGRITSTPSGERRSSHLGNVQAASLDAHVGHVFPHGGALDQPDRRVGLVHVPDGEVQREV